MLPSANIVIVALVITCTLATSKQALCVAKTLSNFDALKTSGWQDIATGAAGRGSRLPSVRYEAEDAGRCVGGKVLGPDYVAYANEVHLATEASQRKACELKRPSKLLDDEKLGVIIALTSPANAFRVRYSIPDAPSGGGTRSKVALTITKPTFGTKADVSTTEVTLTSEYSWYYGSYPFTNNPAAGKGHHYYNEAYILLNETAPIGATLRLSPVVVKTDVPQSKSSCTMNLTTRNRCGYTGITRASCKKLGCCHDNIPNPNQNGYPSCFHPNSVQFLVSQASPPPPIISSSPQPSLPGDTCTQVKPSSRHDCGFNGINETECVTGRGCCWIPNASPNPTHIPDCFYRGSQPPHPHPSPSPSPPLIDSEVTIDLVDSYLVQEVKRPANNTLSIVDFGGDPTGRNDSAAAFDAVSKAAVASGQAVWLPTGIFEISRQIILIDNVTVMGAGAWFSELHWADQVSMGLFGKKARNGFPGSMRVQLFDFAIRGEVRERVDSNPANGLGGAIGSGSVIRGLIIQHTKVGMWFDGPFSNLVISSNIISDTTADGINLHGGIQNVTVEDNHIRNTGDDGIAQWSERTYPRPDRFNAVRFNTVELPILANCIALYGGGDHTVTDNLVADSISSGGGIHIGNRFTSYPLAGQTVIARNTILRGGCMDPNWKFGVGAFWFYALEEVQDGAVLVTDTIINDSPYESVHFIGKSVSNVAFNNLTSAGSGTFFLQLQTKVSASFENVRATKIGFYGIYSCEGASAENITLIGDGNTGWTNSTHCGFPPSVLP